MNFFKDKFKSTRNYLFDHPKLRLVFVYLGILLGAAASAFVFAYGYKTFVAPIEDGVPNIVTGGASGVSQIVVKICELCGVPVESLIGNTSIGYIIQSAMYVIINIPLAFLAFRKIGKRFAVFTIINVGLYFLFVNILPTSASEFFYTSSINLTDDLFVRALLAGICTGLSTGIAVYAGHSAGGIDIVSIYVTSKKTNATMGRVSMIINAGIVAVYTILSCVQDGNPGFINVTIYSLVYFFVSSVVIDSLVIRNKKTQLQIITENVELPEVLITYFPHSATIVNGRGAFTKKDKIVIYTVLSSFEVKRAIKIIREVDPTAFITVTKVEQLVGRFYIEPHK